MSIWHYPKYFLFPLNLTWRWQEDLDVFISVWGEVILHNKKRILVVINHFINFVFHSIQSWNWLKDVKHKISDARYRWGSLSLLIFDLCNNRSFYSLCICWFQRMTCFSCKINHGLVSFNSFTTNYSLASHTNWIQFIIYWYLLEIWLISPLFPFGILLDVDGWNNEIFVICNLL